MGSKQQQRITCHRQRHDWPFLFFCLVPLKLNPPAKFDVCSFILTGDNRGFPKFKSRSRDLGHAPFGPIFYFFVSYSLPSIRLQNLTFVASAYPEIAGVPKFKSRSRDLGHAFFGPFFIFCLVFLTLDHAAKFDVCSFILAGDNRGVPKFKSKSRDLIHAPL